MKKLFLILFITSSIACKKQTETAIKKNNLENTYFKIVGVDKDLSETSTPIFYAKMEPLHTNGGNYSEPLGWTNWVEWVRKQWCDNQAHISNPWYCLICKDYAACITTPVKFISYSIDNRTIKWEVAMEENLNYYRIDSSSNGLTFKQMALFFPNGNLSYSYTIK